MQVRCLLWISIALTGIAGCNAPAHNHEHVPRRMLYVVPEALPARYSWQIHGEPVSDIVWVGTRLNRKGELTGAGTVLAAMDIHSSRPPGDSSAMEIHSRGKFTHHLLVGPTGVDAGTQILTTAPIRTATHAVLVQLLKDSPQVDGLQLDFEYLPPQYATAFVSYIHELRAALPKTKSLHVAVFPPVGMPQAWRGFHNLPELAAASDGIVVMLYDHHRSGTAPGCVSGIGWLQQNVQVLQELPRAKIWLGAPLYGYHFQRKKTSAIGKSRFEKRKGSRSEADGCYQVQSAAGETYYPSHALYLEYDRQVREKGFAGVAYWRAGFER